MPRYVYHNECWCVKYPTIEISCPMADRKEQVCPKCGVLLVQNITEVGVLGMDKNGSSGHR